uniref:Reverse transcriptase domain-containing protein n=1 Tax=Trichobilharzia regenti TaxID=157069 RepID=A0AA85J1L9_TRIRE|nr:unnamed protein product [Trichobilharzia regenti]CAH8862840.1 unnamed protein product [Trichobilharzia regenti]
MNGVYPSKWKQTYIVPRFKSGSKCDVKNYRPINITSVLSRILEKIISTKITDFLLTENLITPSQHGFIKSRSCMTCHLELFDFITGLIDQKFLVLIVYIDLKKAFDKVCHDLLLKKLKAYGISGNLLDWCNSFMRGRSQSVKINDTFSSTTPISSGVIQGSVLGPLFFLIYLNDVCNVIKHGRPFLYADDLKVVYYSTTQELTNLSYKIQSDIDNIETWCKSWMMQINVQKCGLLCSTRLRIAPRITIYDKPITIFPSVLDLGLCYSADFKFSLYVTNQVSKARRLLGFIFHNFQTKESKMLLYRTHIRPLLEYCPFILDSTSVKDKLRIESVQRRFTSRILGTNLKVPYNSRCATLKIEPLWFRRHRLNLILLFKILKGIVYFPNNNLNFSSSTYELRSNGSSLSHILCRTNSRSNFFTVKYRQIWNFLPNEIKNSTTVQRFTHLLHKYFSENSLDTVCHMLKIRDIVSSHSDLCT